MRRHWRVKRLSFPIAGKTTKAKFAGRWPGRRKYTEMLHYYRMITDAEKRSFDAIDSTRQQTRESVTPDVLANAQSALQWLRASIDARRSHAVTAGK